MGVCYYLVCEACNTYIDLHKSYSFYAVPHYKCPPLGKETVLLQGGYWESRGLWFLWKHKEHKGINFHSDHDENWYGIEPKLTEEFPYYDEKERKDEI